MRDSSGLVHTKRGAMSVFLLTSAAVKAPSVRHAPGALEYELRAGSPGR